MEIWLFDSHLRKNVRNCQFVLVKILKWKRVVSLVIGYVLPKALPKLDRSTRQWCIREHHHVQSPCQEVFPELDDGACAAAPGEQWNELRPWAPMATLELLPLSERGSIHLGSDIMAWRTQELSTFSKYSILCRGLGVALLQVDPETQTGHVLDGMWCVKRFPVPCPGHDTEVIQRVWTENNPVSASYPSALTVCRRDIIACKNESQGGQLWGNLYEDLNCQAP